jgi:hypothetical protein
MDEYLFIELAKLQADRRRLEREQRQQQELFDPDTRRSLEGHRDPPRRRWFITSSSWSKQS